MKLLPLAACLLGLASFASADSLRSEVDRANSAVTKAMKSKDMVALEKALRSMVAPNFVEIEHGQKTNIDQTVAGMKSMIGSMKKITVVETKILSLKEKGDKATCRMFHSLGGIMVGPNNKDSAMIFTGTSEETYIKVKGKWKLAVVSWVSQKALLDGKPMGAPSAPPKKG